MKISDDLENKILNIVYPVGSIYVSMNSTNPSSIIGGTWTQIKDKFLYCTTSSKVTGGSTTTGSHTLTVDEIPAHSHGSKTLTGGFYAYDYTGSRANGIVSESNANNNGVGFSNNATAETPWKNFNIKATHEHNSVGGGGSHTHSQNLPPYITCYAWYRTA